MSEPAAPRTKTQGPDDAIISVRELVVRYGDHTILNGVDLDIQAGETMVIPGRERVGEKHAAAPYHGS